MNVNEAIRKRRSIRNFRPQKVEEAKINQVLEAARLAPSGVNIQPWRFVVIESDEMREKLKDYTLDFVAEAPVIMVCCVDLTSLQDRKERLIELHKADAFTGTNLDKINPDKYTSRGMDEVQKKTYLHLNCAIAVENMILQAVELGLGSCWIKLFKQEKISELLELDDNLEIVSLLPLGYYDKNPELRPRFSLEEIVINRI